MIRTDLLVMTYRGEPVAAVLWGGGLAADVQWEGKLVADSLQGGIAENTAWTCSPCGYQ